MRRWIAPVLFTVPTGGCEGIQSILDPHGYSAGRIETLWWVMLALGAAVWVVVVGLAIYVLFVKRGGVSAEPITERTEGDGGRARIVVYATLTSLLILVVVFVASVLTGRAIQSMAAEKALTIEVIGHQWWWEVRYKDPEPSRRFETANELHIPAGEPVRIELRSQDVVHSFWVPNLSGKTDLIPGRTNTLWVKGEDPGVYRGQCAQFCGLQHANMAFTVVVHEPEEYRQWVARQLSPAPAPVLPAERAGELVFASRGCVLCHTIRGTPAKGDVGPDLTHLASRLTLASGILPNTVGHLGGWISNPQVIKPGNRMPRVPLDSEELQALLAYLQTLQ